MDSLRSHGASLSPFYTRDMLALMAEVLPEQADDALDIIAQTVREPFFDDAAAIAHTKADIEFQIAEYRNAPAQFMPEMLHAVAFEGPTEAHMDGGLARPMLCSAASSC